MSSPRKVCPVFTFGVIQINEFSFFHVVVSHSRAYFISYGAERPTDTSGNKNENNDDDDD